MSEDAVDGVLIVVGEKVCFIPRDDLRSYRLPDDAAAAARQQLDVQIPEVMGFGPDQLALGGGMVLGVQYTVKKPGSTAPVVQMSSLMAHALTVIKE